VHLVGFIIRKKTVNRLSMTWTTEKSGFDSREGWRVFSSPQTNSQAHPDTVPTALPPEGSSRNEVKLINSL